MHIKTDVEDIGAMQRGAPLACVHHCAAVQCLIATTFLTKKAILTLSTKTGKLTLDHAVRAITGPNFRK